MGSRRNLLRLHPPRLREPGGRARRQRFRGRRLRLQLRPGTRIVMGVLRPLLACALLAVAVAHGDVLPPDEANAMYKHYEGGGIVAEGPAYLVRKSIGDQVSVHAEYEIDQVTGASIDMITSGASPLREDRKAKSLGVDYLREK